jgi:CRISPR-associated protein Cas1
MSHSAIIAYDIVDNKQRRKAFRCLEAAQQRETSQKLHHADTIDKLMGLEGALAAAWFSLLATVLPEKWRFTGRNRRPPQDPFNALLSLAYTLLMAEIRQVLISEGLDPAFGYLHQPVAGREALVLDFTELFRATADFGMYALLEQLSPEDFAYTHDYGCRLTKTARPEFYSFWAQFREQCPKLSTNQEKAVDFSPLPEQIRGKVAKFRELLKNQELSNG